MYTINSYNNTKCDLEMARHRLSALMIDKEHLYTKYFPITPKLKDIPTDSHQKSDKMAQYVAELTKINPLTGMSLDGEIEYVRNLIGKFEYLMKSMDICLEKYEGIEGYLYKKIVKDNVPITKAVNKTAEKFHIEPQTIWKNYYKKIEKEIKKLRLI